VWLLSSDRLRLFDGTRFARDVTVPGEVRGGPNGTITDMVEVGAEAWVASRAGVARFASGSWTRLASDQITEVGSLAADTDGAVWADGRIRTQTGSHRAVVGFDAGGRWSEASGEGAPRNAHEVVERPSGGVLARGARSLAWFGGTGWEQLPILPAQVGGPVGLGTAVTDDGVVWARGDRGLARLAPGGEWERVLVGPESGVWAMTASGRSLLVLRGPTLLRLGSGDDRDEVVWHDDGPALVATHAIPASWAYAGPPERGDALLPVRVVARSRSEAWAAAAGYPYPFRLDGSRWREVPVLVDPLTAERAVVAATDGAFWVLADSGLLRYRGADPPEELTRISGGRLIAGSAGSVWVQPAWWYGWWYLSSPNARGDVGRPGLVHVEADGVRSVVPLPVDSWTLTSAVADPEGGLWLTLCRDGDQDPCPTGTELMSWEGDRWRPVSHPGQTVIAGAVTEDGSLWSVLRREGGAVSELARHRDGEWTTWPVPGLGADVLLAPDGSACGVRDAGTGLTCVDVRGEVVLHDLGVSGTASIDREGNVWIAGAGGIALLPTAFGR
jgi:hypothetical protein